jgi:cytochrome P450
VGVIPELRGDRLGFLLRTAREYGGVVRLAGIGRRRFVYLVTSPEGVKRILQDNAENYGRRTRGVAALRATLGDGLLTTTGDSWRRSRRLAQPAFHKQRLAGFSTVMASAAVGLVERWRGLRAAPLDVPPELSRVTLQILGRCLFGRDLTDEADAIGRSLQVVLHHTVELTQTLFPIPTAVPTPRNVRFRRALGVLEGVVLNVIEERRRLADSDAGDLLSMLIASHDEETGGGFEQKQLRDEVMTLLLAGHETTAMTLAWTFYLLSLHPPVRRNLEAELAEVLAGRPPELADLPRLRYTRMVLEESLRLYPPAWILTRSAERADELDGYAVPAGAILFLSPYVTHRDPALWENPEGFDPERFAPEREEARPRYAYFPFGGGPHLCIGAAFAMMEATIVLATVAQHLHLDLEPGREVTPDPLVTLRPRGGIWMNVRARPSP